MPDTRRDARDRKQSALANMAMGATAGTLAASVCYPLDTIRRRMQMVGRVYGGQLDAFATIWREVGGGENLV